MLVLALLAGCGFQMRGAVTVPESVQRTYIDAVDPYSLFYQEFRSSLTAAGVDVVEYDGVEISSKGSGGPTCLTRPIVRSQADDRVNIQRETEFAVTMKTLTEEVKVKTEDIASRTVMEQSLMPEGLLLALQPDDVRDLIAYLQKLGSATEVERPDADDAPTMIKPGVPDKFRD